MKTSHNIMLSFRIIREEMIRSKILMNNCFKFEKNDKLLHSMNVHVRSLLCNRINRTSKLCDYWLSVYSIIRNFCNLVSLGYPVKISGVKTFLHFFLNIYYRYKKTFQQKKSKTNNTVIFYLWTFESGFITNIIPYKTIMCPHIIRRKYIFLTTNLTV